MSSTAHGTTPYYYVPQPSRHPVMAAIGLFFVILGAGQWINGTRLGQVFAGLWLAWWLFVLYQWFRDAVAESEGGQYGHKIDLSFRWSMSWFIFSEVMFFGAFFHRPVVGAFALGARLGSLENALLWPDFKAVWPSVAAGATPRRPASSSPSRPWAPSGCPPSTQRCC
jgi:cytochrome c oxidase subunit 3